MGDSCGRVSERLWFVVVKLGLACLTGHGYRSVFFFFLLLSLFCCVLCMGDSCGRVSERPRHVVEKLGLACLTGHGYRFNNTQLAHTRRSCPFGITHSNAVAELCPSRGRGGGGAGGRRARRRGGGAEK